MNPTISWINAAGGDWNTGSNWSGGLPPTPVDNVVIALPGTYTISVPGVSTAVSVTLNDAGATLSVSGNGADLVSGPLLIDAGTVSLGQGADIQGVIDIAGGSFTSDSGFLTGSTVEGTLVLAPQPFGLNSPALNIQDGLALEGAGGIGSGTIDLSNGYYLTFVGPQTLSGGTVVLTGSSFLRVFPEGVGGTALTLAPNATVVVESTGTIDSVVFGSGAVINQGLISVLPGADLQVDVSLFNAGTIAVAPGGSLDLVSGGLANTGTIIGTGGTITVEGGATDAELLSLGTSGATVVLGCLVDNTGRTLSVGPGGAIPLLTLNGGGGRSKTASCRTPAAAWSSTAACSAASPTRARWSWGRVPTWRSQRVLFLKGPVAPVRAPSMCLAAPSTSLALRQCPAATSFSVRAGAPRLLLSNLAGF